MRACVGACVRARRICIVLPQRHKLTQQRVCHSEISAEPKPEVLDDDITLSKPDRSPSRSRRGRSTSPRRRPGSNRASTKGSTSRLGTVHYRFFPLKPHWARIIGFFSIICHPNHSSVIDTSICCQPTTNGFFFLGTAYVS